MKRSKMNTNSIQAQSIPALQKEALRLKGEFEDYLDDLRLFSNPEFWKAVQQIQQCKTKKFPSVHAMLNDLNK